MRTSRPWRPAAACRTLSIAVTFASIAGASYAASLSGRVVDQQGAPVANARVVVATPLGAVADRRAADNGSFDISPLAAGTYEVRAFAEGLQGDPATVTLSADDARTINIVLRVSAVTESLVVSASNVDLPLSRAADTVTVISGADIEARQIETVADALRSVPALGVTRSGGRGAITSLFPRGGGSNYTLVLVDGIRANAFGGGYDFGHLSAFDVDRIEVVRGPESALFGSDATGAVVQIVTKRGGRPRADVLVEGGNQSTARVAASTAGSHGAWSWGGALEQYKTDGYTGVAPATGELVSNDDDHLRRASGTMRWQSRSGADVAVSGNIGHDERGVPGPFGSNPIGAFTAVDRLSRGINDPRQLGGRVTHPWSTRARQRIELNVFDLSSNFTSQFGPSTSGSRRVDARVQEDVTLSESFGLSGGVELLRERGSSSFITGLTDEPLPIERGVVGTFAELRYESGNRLFITGGGRLERLTRDALEANVGQFTSRPAFPEQTIDSFNPKLAMSYVAGATRVHASAGTGIRPPDAFEIAFTDNPNLKPERSRSVDAGIERQFAGGSVAVGATAFFNRYDDLLVTVGRSLRDASRYRTDNISNARARGVELTTDARASRRLTVRGTYTWLDTEVLSVDGLANTAPPPFTVGDPLIRRPRHQGSIGATLTSDRVTLFGDVTGRSRVLDVEPNFGAFGGLFHSAGYAVASIGGTFRVMRNLDAYARLLNVADREYEEALGFPALRRSAIVGVRVAAGR